MPITATRIKLAEVTSGPKPQPGQKHRSSGDFTTQEAPPGTNRLSWEVSQNPNSDQIEFDVMEDKSVSPDPVIFSGVVNGSVTKYGSFRALYIANPRNAGDADFLVTVYAETI